MFCKVCGAELNEGTDFCSNCGAATKKEGQVAGNTSAYSTMQTNNMFNAGAMGQTGETVGAKKKKDAKGKGGIIAVVIAVVLIAAVGIGCALYFTSDSYKCKKNLKMAEKYFDEEEYKDALECYNEVLTIDPSFGEAYLQSAEIYLIQGKGEEAVKILNKGLKKVGKDEKDDLTDKLEEAYRGAIETCLEDGEFEKVLEYCETAGIDSEEFIVNFVELEPDEIGGQFVYVDLDINFGCFMEEYGNVDALYYVIWTGDDDVEDWRYMAIKVSEDYEKKMDRMFDGDDTPIRFYGEIKKMDNEDYSYFKDYFIEADFTDEEFEELTLPYYIDACY